MALAAIAWLFTIWSSSGVSISGALLPTGLERLENQHGAPDAQPVGQVPFGLIRNPSVWLWWLSLAWLETGMAWAGALLQRAGVGAGGLLGRLEGRFYLPLALILTLMALIAITR